MTNDAAGFGGAGGCLEMNVYKPLMIFNTMRSITIISGRPSQLAYTAKQSSQKWRSEVTATAAQRNEPMRNSISVCSICSRPSTGLMGQRDEKRCLMVARGQ
jgi:fumarate hydratase class II